MRDRLPACFIEDNETGGALLAAPIVKEKVFLGFIAVETKETTARFDHNHTILLASVCGAFAEAIENARHRQEEQDRQRFSTRKL